MQTVSLFHRNAKVIIYVMKIMASMNFRNVIWKKTSLGGHEHLLASCLDVQLNTFMLRER